MGRVTGAGLPQVSLEASIRDWDTGQTTAGRSNMVHARPRAAPKAALAARHAIARMARRLLAYPVGETVYHGCAREAAGSYRRSHCRSGQISATPASSTRFPW